MGNRRSRLRSLSRPLASVEFALIMQFCSLKDLLRLARCNRTTLSAASNPIAWADRPAYTVDFAKLPKGFHRSLIIQHPIVLRLWVTRPPASVEWNRLLSTSAAPPILSAGDLDAIRRIPFLVKLDVSRPDCIRGVLQQLDGALPRVEEIISRRSQWRSIDLVDDFPTTLFPPSLLRYLCRGEGTWTEGWRTQADQPWIVVHLDIHRYRGAILLYEHAGASGKALAHPAFVGTGDLQLRDLERLASTLRNRLPLGELLNRPSRDSDQPVSLRAMAHRIAEYIRADEMLLYCFAFLRPQGPEG